MHEDAHSLVTDLRRAIPLDTHSLSLCSLATSGKHCSPLGTEVMHQVKRAAPHRVLFWRCFEPHNSSLVPSGLEILQGGHKARSLNWKFYSLLLLRESSSLRLRCLFFNSLRNHLGWAGDLQGLQTRARVALLQEVCSMPRDKLTLAPLDPSSPCWQFRDWGRSCPLQGGEEGAGAARVGLCAGLRTSCATGTEASSKECTYTAVGAGSSPKGRFGLGLANSSE